MIRNSISSRVIDQPAQQVKGKSFRFFAFDKGQTYVNNDFYQDFVTYAGGLYACIASEVVNEIPDQSDKWMLAVDAIQGEQGGYYIPSYDEKKGTITFTPSGIEDAEAVTTTDIRGTDGKNMEFEWDGFKLRVRKEGDTDWTEKDLRGPGMEFVWANGKLGVRPEGSDPETSYEFGPDFTGPQGSSIVMQVDEDRNMLEYRYDNEDIWKDLYNLGQLKGERGPGVVLFRNAATGDIMMRSEDETTEQAVTLLYANDVKGSDGVSIAKTYTGSDGYLYVCYSDNPDKPMRAGYVRGPKGDDGRQIMLRVDNDIDEFGNKGTGTHIQWKWDGDDYKLWTNLIQINEMFNIVMGGLKLDTHEVQYPNEEGILKVYDRFILNYYKTEYDEDNNLVFGDLIQTISYVDIPKDVMADVVPVKTFKYKKAEMVDETKLGVMVALKVFNGQAYACDAKNIYNVLESNQLVAIGAAREDLDDSFIDMQVVDGRLIAIGNHAIYQYMEDTKRFNTIQEIDILHNGIKNIFCGEFAGTPEDSIKNWYTYDCRVMYAVDFANAEGKYFEPYMNHNDPNMWICSLVLNGNVYLSDGQLCKLNYYADDPLERIYIDLLKQGEKIVSLSFDEQYNNMYICSNMALYMWVDMNEFVKLCDNPFKTDKILSSCNGGFWWTSGSAIYTYSNGKLIKSFDMPSVATNMVNRDDIVMMSNSNDYKVCMRGVWSTLAITGELVDFVIEDESVVWVLDKSDLYRCELQDTDYGYLRKPNQWVPLIINGESVDDFGAYTIKSEDKSLIIESIANGINVIVDRTIIDEKIQKLKLEQLPDEEVEDPDNNRVYKLVDEYDNQLGTTISVRTDAFINSSIDGKISKIKVVKVPDEDIEDETIASTYKLVDEYDNQLGTVINILKDKFLKKVEYNEETRQLEFTFIVADGTEQIVGVAMDVSYGTNIDDEVTVVYSVGGISRGTKAKALKGKSFTEVFDEIFFPTIQPTITQPSCNLVVSPQYIQIKEGNVWPTVSEDAITVNRGSAVADTVSQVYAGEAISKEIVTNPENIMGQPVIYREVAYEAKVTFAPGEELKDNKGDPSTEPAYPGGTATKAAVVYGRYMWFANGTLATDKPNDYPSNQDMNSILPQISTVIYAAYMSETTTGVRSWFDIHDTQSITKVEFYDTNSGTWKTYDAANYSVTPSAEMHDGLSYSRWTTTGALSGSMYYRFTCQYNG